jgi:hypothetical protein
MRFALLLALACPAWGVTVGTPTVEAFQNSCRISATVTPNAYAQAYWGVAMGGPYPYNTAIYQTGNQPHPPDTGLIALSLFALQPGTVYYGVLKAQPNNNNTTGQVVSSEFTCTTTTGSAFPTAPTEYNPAFPTISGSGWTTVPMQVTGGVYVAAATVTHTGGVFCASDPSWTVTMGDSLQTVLGEVNFGANIDVVQAGSGAVPNVTNGGYIFPPLAVDPCASGISDVNHRWIMLQTHQVAAADFPPFGFRTGPQWTSKLANFVAQPSPHGLNTVGEVFSMLLPGSSAVGVHHIWLSNLEMSVNAASTQQYGAMIVLSNAYIDAFDAKTPASYIVLDRLYVNPPAAPSGIGSAIEGTIGANVAMIGNYLVGPQVPNSGSVAQGIYIQDCSVGPLGIINNEVDAAGQGIYFEWVGSQSCGAAGNQQIIMQNATVKKNAVYASAALLNPVNPGYGAWDGVTRANNRNPIETKNCQICLYSGNWIDGSFSGQNSGQAIVVTGSGPAVGSPSGAGHLNFSFNYIRHAAVIADMDGSASNESCCGYAPDAALNHNILFSNNLAVDIGRYLYTQTGSVGGTYSNYLQNFGVQNYQVINNSFDFSNGVWAPGGNFYSPFQLLISDGNMAANGLSVHGNMWFYSYGSSGESSSGVWARNYVCSQGCATFPVVPYPAGGSTNKANLDLAAVNIAAAVTPSWTWQQNVNVGGLNAVAGECGVVGATGANPMVLDMGSNYCAGLFLAASTVNIGLAGGFSSFGTGCGAMLGAHTVTTSATQFLTIPLNGTGCTYTANAGIVWWPDMDQSLVTAASADMPPADKWPAGATMALRIAAAGWLNYANHDLTVTPTASNYGGSMGANLQGLTAELGIVKNISVVAGPTSLQFSYTAPDANTCAVDTSPNGTTWTRTTDSGGARTRTLLVPSLSASTAYQYRLMCYYSQSRPWFSVPWEQGNMTTEATATTTANITSTVSVQLGCSGIIGAMSVKVTFTPLSGSPVNGVSNCTGTVSVASKPNGAAQELIQYYSAANAGGSLLPGGGSALIP